MERWVFAYGSLIWNPEFRSIRRMRAKLEGYHRSLCLYSTHYRGTKECPGLVFALDNGGSCEGVAYEVSNDIWEDVDHLLRKRELVSDAYDEVMHYVTLSNGRSVFARTYVMNHASGQYAGHLSSAEIVEIVKRGEGCAGTCLDYVANTAQELKKLGIQDDKLDAVLALF